MKRFCCRLWTWLALCLWATAALGHVAATSAVYLDIGRSAVDLEIHLPLKELRQAAPEAFAGGDVPEPDVLFDYLRGHIALVSPDGAPFVPEPLAVPGVIKVQERPFVAIRLRFRAPEGVTMGNFRLHYSAILHRVVSHKTYVSLRSDIYNGHLTGAAEPLGVIRYRNETVAVERAGSSRWAAFRAMLAAGAHHIAGGTDHLLFLLVLLLPAPLIARGGRWRQAAGGGWWLPVVKIVTAFTLGHSLTLALAALGLVRLPPAPVEILVAASILVSAAHAVWPVFGRRAHWVAGGFGLVHGLAFANELHGLGFSVEALVLALAGFNLGIEGIQLLILAAVVPLLRAVAFTSLYAPLRNACALFAALAALGWVLERAWSIQTPFILWVEQAAENALWIYAALAIAAALASARLVCGKVQAKAR